jgi:mediator of RNA polymerase II transcription subunit 21
MKALPKKVCTIHEGTVTRAEVRIVDPLPADQFKAGQTELAQDIILKEQQIEYLISMLPGLDNSENDQQKRMKELEEDLKVAEEERLRALKEKEEVLTKLETVIRSIKRT